MEQKDIVLDVRKLNTSFVSDGQTIRIVKDVSFQLKRGKTLAIVGESGCGKSVTVHSIVKLLPQNARFNADAVFMLSGFTITRSALWGVYILILKVFLFPFQRNMFVF